MFDQPGELPRFGVNETMSKTINRTMMPVRATSAKIKRFRSLYDVTLPLGKLTVLVGANSSGKSNSLHALNFFHQLVANGTPPPTQLLKEFTYMGGVEPISYELDFEIQQHKAAYSLQLGQDKAQAIFQREQLWLDQSKIIDVTDGEGTVKDEANTSDEGKASEQIYKSNNLAIRSAGDFGNKPLTQDLGGFIRDWKVFNLKPDNMRGASFVGMDLFLEDEDDEEDSKVPKLDARGQNIQRVLLHLCKKKGKRLEALNEDLNDILSIRFQLGQSKKNGKPTLKVLESNGVTIHPSQISDGTWRMIAYCTLLHTSEWPLIAIEEPESNLHPGILKHVVRVLKRLSERRQVIISTHSSQLLDCFSSTDVGKDTSILFLQRIQGKTQVLPLQHLMEHSPGLQSWMNDFGIGSAIFHSKLLEECLGRK